MRFTIYQESRIGKRRSNQDRIGYVYSRDALLMVIADGMGGHLHGEIAAHLAVQFMTDAFQREAKPVLSDPAMFLSKCLSRAHNAILGYSIEKNLPETPRTTIVACIIQEGFAHWAHAGDSRLYLIREGNIIGQTNDHSRLQQMLDQGLISASDAAHHPGRNRIYSCLGGDRPPQIEYSSRFHLETNDVIALCTDGLWGPLSSEEISQAFADTDVMTVAPRLLDEAEQRAGKQSDNLSLVAMCWQEESLVDNAVTTQFMALDAFTSWMEPMSAGSGHLPELTDEEIEKTIAEINDTINKFSRH